MVAAYLSGAVEPPSFIDKLLGRADAKKAALELNDYLAQVPTFGDIDTDRVHALALKAGDFTSTAFQQGYSSLSENNLDGATRQAITRLGLALGFSDQRCSEQWLAVVTPRIAEKAARLAGGDSISEDMGTQLRAYVRKFGIEETETNSVMSKAVSQFLSDRCATLLSTGEISDQDNETLRAISRAFGAEATFQAETQRRWDVARQAWAITHGRIPTVNADLLLHAREECYSEIYAEYFQIKKIRDSYSYSGPSIRIRIAKGVSYRMGNIRVTPHTHNEMVSQGRGKLSITNQRIVFNSSAKNVSATLKSIVSFEIYSDGLELRKGSGSPLYFKCDHNPEMTKRLFDRLFSDLADG